MAFQFFLLYSLADFIKKMCEVFEAFNSFYCIQKTISDVKTWNATSTTLSILSIVFHRVSRRLQELRCLSILSIVFTRRLGLLPQGTHWFTFNSFYCILSGLYSRIVRSVDGTFNSFYCIHGDFEIEIYEEKTADTLSILSIVFII